MIITSVLEKIERAAAEGRLSGEAVGHLKRWMGEADYADSRDEIVRLVEAGHSVIVIEHSLEVIASADWVIDLGPEGGDMGGRLIAEGPPSAIAQCAISHTGSYLKRRHCSAK